MGWWKSSENYYPLRIPIDIIYLKLVDILRHFYRSCGCFCHVRYKTKQTVFHILGSFLKNIVMIPVHCQVGFRVHMEAHLWVCLGSSRKTSLFRKDLCEGGQCPAQVGSWTEYRGGASWMAAFPSLLPEHSWHVMSCLMFLLLNLTMMDCAPSHWKPKNAPVF